MLFTVQILPQGPRQVRRQISGTQILGICVHINCYIEPFICALFGKAYSSSAFANTFRPELKNFPLDTICRLHICNKISGQCPTISCAGSIGYCSSNQPLNSITRRIKSAPTGRNPSPRMLPSSSSIKVLFTLFSNRKFWTSFLLALV